MFSVDAETVSHLEHLSPVSRRVAVIDSRHKGRGISVIFVKILDSAVMIEDSMNGEAKGNCKGSDNSDQFAV